MGQIVSQFPFARRWVKWPQIYNECICRSIFFHPETSLPSARKYTTNGNCTAWPPLNMQHLISRGIKFPCLSASLYLTPQLQTCGYIGKKLFLLSYTENNQQNLRKNTTRLLHSIPHTPLGVCLCLQTLTSAKIIYCGNEVTALYFGLLDHAGYDQAVSRAITVVLLQSAGSLVESQLGYHLS